MPKRIMREFSLAEIAAVDNPAQAGATMSIMKARHLGGNPPEEPASLNEEEDTLSKSAQELQAELTKSADDLAKANARAERAESIAKMSDAEKAHFNTLEGAAADEFLAKSAEDRAAIVKSVKKAADEANPVVYKALDGTVYRENDDARLISMAKRDDEREKEMAKMRSDAADAAFEKSGSTNFAKFKGTSSVKGALAKAVAGIKDDDTRKGVEEMLKAAHAAVGLTLKEVGTSSDADSDDDEDGNVQKSSKAASEAKLDQLAKAHAEKEKVPYAKAYQAVLETEEGKALYAKAI